MKERDVSRYLNKRVKELGGEIRRVTWQGRRNAPDKLVMLEGRSFFVEEKRPDEHATPAQRREHKRLRDAGLEVRVVSDYYTVEAALSDSEDDLDDFERADGPRWYPPPEHY